MLKIALRFSYVCASSVALKYVIKMYSFNVLFLSYAYCNSVYLRCGPQTLFPLQGILYFSYSKSMSG